ncbi:hypothetical protein [Kitasatospora phosalacinea]|uniref:Cellulose-binding protein n=1 Tax=Kitasatospora phosalacinea TaxID=2065 RepID=A0A9W6PMY8_9ACTN|nr:hypothetical protein [Kitasatospora phosalacinea]GLW57818.1 hypothetical protein Kpho01_58290 [Kitasatospora phosalacinea]
MSDAVSQYGFTPSRRGYAPEQVDAAVTDLSRARDEAWERLSVLGGGLREMEKRLADIKQAAEDAPDPDFAELSDQAAVLLGIALNEADAVHAKAKRSGEDARDAAHEAGEAAAKAAKEYAAKLREETDQFVRRTDERSRAEAERIRAEADAEARALVHAATGHAARVRVAAANASEQSESALAERRRKADEDFTAAETAADAAVAKVTAAADARVKEAEQHREAMLDEARRLDTDAQAKADAALAAAKEKAARIKAASEREQADFTKRLDKVQTHLDHIKGTLASLTGAAVGAIEDPEDAAEAVAAKKADLAKAPATDQPTTVLGPVKPKQDDPRKPYAPAEPAQPPAPPAEPPAASAEPASLTKEPLPPKPATAPEADPKPATAPDATVEERIVPKIVIVDDGIDHDTRPDRNRIQRKG